MAVEGFGILTKAEIVFQEVRRKLNTAKHNIHNLRVAAETDMLKTLKPETIVKMLREAQDALDEISTL